MFFTVVGFPLGAMSTKAKTVEAIEAVKDGADEIDMVMNIGELKAGNDEAVLADANASTFINRFEYMNAFRKAYGQQYCHSKKERT